MMSKCLRIDLNHLQNRIVHILFITHIYNDMSMIVAQMLYYLSLIYGKYNFAWFNMFKIGMMINERIEIMFCSRLCYSHESVLYESQFLSICIFID